MTNIATGLKKRGSRHLFECNYSSAVECFARVHSMEPDNVENTIDLIYALNQNADYVTALTYCYALLGEGNIKELDTLYFLTAEAFGGAGCVEGCAQMLERCINYNPIGTSSADAEAFLNDLKQKYTIEKYDATTNAVTMLLPNGMSDAPFLNYETLICVKDISEAIKEKDINGAMNRIEEEIDAGNISVSILGVAIMLCAELGDTIYMKKNAERFRFVDDYTMSELYALAYNLDDLKNDDIAYIVYRELYAKESGDKDIAFGFAVASERVGNIEHAKSIAKKIIASDGGRGPATYYYNEIGRKVHPYLLKYEDEHEQNILDRITSGYTNSNEIYEAIDYLRYADIETGTKIIESLDKNDYFTCFELRRAAINPKNNLILRARAASKIFDNNIVYLNTGSDIIEFSPEIEKVINNFYERGNQ